MKFLPFLPSERGVGKCNVLFLCLCFHLNFLLLNEFPCSKFKKVAISKKNSVSYPIIYIGLIQARQYLKPIHNICYKSWYYIFRIFVIIIYIIVIDDALIWWPFFPLFFCLFNVLLFHLFVGLGLYLLWCFIVILPRQKWLSNLMEPWKMDWFLVCTLTTREDVRNLRLV